MKKYWIIENGRPIGPFSQQELKVRRDFTAALPVWCAEYADWTTVGQVPELACLLEVTTEEETPVANEATTVVVEEQVKTEEAPKVQATPWIITTPPDEINGVKRPKSFMGWNIAMLICCCMPAGVAGLIFSSQVNRHWMQGNVEKAQKASEYAEWCVILSFVLGLVVWPFQMIFSLL